MRKKKVCILVFANIAFDIRVQRQIEAARQHYDVDVVAQGDWNAPEGVRYLPVHKTIFKASPASAAMLAVGNINSAYWEKYYWRRKEYQQALDLIKSNSYDLIHANDLDALPVAIEASKYNKTPVLFDAHEYYLEQGETRLAIAIRKPFRRYLFNTYGRDVSRVITVSEGISRLYNSEFGWKSDVIMNAPFYVKHDFHEVDPSRINLVNHGRAINGRRIEDLITMMPKLDSRFHLNLLLIPSRIDYYESLKSKVARVAPGRVSILDPVAPDMIIDAINQFDIGVITLESKKLTHYYALPKKMFDYVMAGLCVIVTPLEEMKKIVESGEIGLVADGHSPDAMAESLNSLTADQINSYKRNSLHLAKSLTANAEMEKLMRIYSEMLS